MKILQISDLHGNLRLLRHLRPTFPHYDLVVLSGDNTNFKGRAAIEEILNHILPYNPKVLAVHGNCDLPEVRTYLGDKGFDLHGNQVAFNGNFFFGYGGSMPCPGGRTPSDWPERDAKEALQKVKLISPGKTICVVHQPPSDSSADRIHSGAHVGSRAIRDFLMREKPLVCLTGHIHESPCAEIFGSSLLVNPGAGLENRYACITIDGEGARAELLKA